MYTLFIDSISNINSNLIYSEDISFFIWLFFIFKVFVCTVVLVRNLKSDLLLVFSFLFPFISLIFLFYSDPDIVLVEKTRGFYIYQEIEIPTPIPDPLIQESEYAHKKFPSPNFFLVSVVLVISLGLILVNSTPEI